MPLNNENWPYLNSDAAVFRVPQYTQELAETLSNTVGQAVPPVDAPVDTGWIDVELLSPFLPRSVATRPQVRKTQDGMVHFRGQFAPATLPNSSSHSVLQIPTGFIPEVEHRWIGAPSLRWQSLTLGGYISESTGVLYLQPGTGPSAPIDLPTHWSIIIAPWQAAS